MIKIKFQTATLFVSDKITNFIKFLPCQALISWLRCCKFTKKNKYNKKMYKKCFFHIAYRLFPSNRVINRYK